jgi:hypothetical protein
MKSLMNLDGPHLYTLVMMINLQRKHELGSSATWPCADARAGIVALDHVFFGGDTITQEHSGSSFG